MQVFDVKNSLLVDSLSYEFLQQLSRKQKQFFLIVFFLEKCGLFSDFQYGFRSSRSTADLLTVVSDRIARAFNRSGAT